MCFCSLLLVNIDSDFGKIEFQRLGVALEPGGQDWLTSVKAAKSN